MGLTLRRFARREHPNVHGPDGGDLDPVTSALVLVHSPSVGPATWEPVAQRLSELGHEVTVPSLLSVGRGPAPYWPAVTAAVARALPDAWDVRPVILVGHSNAGCFLPVIADALRDRIESCVFVDAALPPREGSTAVAPAEFMPFLEALTVDGVLPPWTDWWDESDIAPMFPSPQVRQVVSAEQPRLPIEYYRQAVPVPASWREVRCAYLAFSAAYDRELARARAWGWPTDRLAGEHLHQLVDPAGVADRILELAAAAHRPAQRRS